jgi:hypothetical protein
LLGHPQLRGRLLVPVRYAQPGEQAFQRESALTKVGLASIAFVLASVLALLSVLIQRTGPELVEYGNLCGPTLSSPCHKPALKGGFPIAYLSDAPGVSVERQLAFIEDNLHPEALALDVAIYFAVILFAGWIASRSSRRVRIGRRV